MSAAAARSTLVAIVPAFNASATVGDCVAALRASHRAPDRIVLFDDGSTDDTGAIARRHGVEVIRNDGPPIGPGLGRNAAALAATETLLLFCDADVVVHADAIGRLEAEVIASPDIAAAFGSYDESPLSQRGAALYANLRHHFVHQRGDREAGTFWAGLGIVRTSAFLSVGGFSPRFGRPSIEDIELGIRLKRQRLGRIRLVPEAQGTHCKDWGTRQLWKTDILSRAAPWSRLIASGETEGNQLNLVPAERMSAVLAHIVLLAVLLAIFAPVALVAAGLAAMAYIWLNRDFLRLLARRGPSLALRGLGYHWLYHLYASVTFALVLLRVRMSIKLSPAPRQPEAQREHR